ncbi:NADP-dependent oxidoreductase [Carnobacterium sp.]|uniref:NADP-dependent oxidoreductase n=1 Tax=Carnobacterium sp. TaxID=48221 RepID=UPI003C7457B5
MKAICVYEFGGVDQLKLRNVEKPIPKEDEVLVKVYYAGVLPSDFKIRQGKFGKRSFPYTPGIAVSGVIEEIGEDVVGFKVEDAVFGRAKRGAYKEYATIPMKHLTHKPEQLLFKDATTITAGAEAAWEALFSKGDLKKEQRVLIHGAAGGVGHFAVQLARWKGSEVIGTASTKNQNFLKEIGVDQAIDYSVQKFEKEVGQVDLVIDLIGGETQKKSWSIIKPGGKLVSLIGIDNELASKYPLVIAIYSQDSPPLNELNQLSGLMAQGIINAEIEAIYPFEKVREATKKCESKHGRGRILLQVHTVNKTD